MEKCVLNYLQVKYFSMDFVPPNLYFLMNKMLKAVQLASIFLSALILMEMSRSFYLWRENKVFFFCLKGWLIRKRSESSKAKIKKLPDWTPVLQCLQPVLPTGRVAWGQSAHKDCCVSWGKFSVAVPFCCGAADNLPVMLRLVKLAEDFGNCFPKDSKLKIYFLFF